MNTYLANNPPTHTETKYLRMHTTYLRIHTTYLRIHTNYWITHTHTHTRTHTVPLTAHIIQFPPHTLKNIDTYV